MSTSFESQRGKLLEDLDGFRVEIYPDRERADIILDRLPLN
ncbi:MAG: enoyl-CoA hydratase/isomerase family protein, partial [Alphaproteobacteria bacterium]|nr:enoyl-CoA hydratase/isomerase family protein [Alphaproteobacteria bacterium]